MGGQKDVDDMDALLEEDAGEIDGAIAKLSTGARGAAALYKLQQHIEQHPVAWSPEARQSNVASAGLPADEPPMVGCPLLSGACELRAPSRPRALRPLGLPSAQSSPDSTARPSRSKACAVPQSDRANGAKQRVMACELEPHGGARAQAI
eukprot:3761507-Amphidinium_carterae.1